MRKEPSLFDFEVRHPDYPTVTVSTIGPDSASLSAAVDRWGLSKREWGQIAGYISVRNLGRTLKHYCRVCGKEILGPQTGLCPDCARADARYRREKAEIKVDRRPYYGRG